MNTHYKINGEALKLANAFGFMFPGEVFLLQAIAQSLPTGAVAVCIGAGAGTGSLAIAEITFGRLVMYTIDISEGGPIGGLQNERTAFKQADMLNYLPTQWLGDSSKVCRVWEQSTGSRPIDLLFIDGDHAETALQADIDGWTPFVRKGGYVAYHDYDSVMWGGVTAVVDRNMRPPAWRTVHHVDTLAVYQRIAVKGKAK